MRALLVAHDSARLSALHAELTDDHDVILARDADEALSRILRSPWFDVIACELPAPEVERLRDALKRLGGYAWSEN